MFNLPSAAISLDFFIFFFFVCFFANQEETKSQLLHCKNRLFQKPGRQLHKTLQGLYVRTQTACSVFDKEDFQATSLSSPSSYCMCMCCIPSKPYVPIMFEAWWMRAAETCQHNRCSLSLHNPPWCASRLQDTTLNTPQRNLQWACAHE